MVCLSFCFVPLFSWELGKVGFFHNSLMLSLVLLLLISFQVGILIIFDSAPESIKKSFQDLVVKFLSFLDFLRRMELSKFFSLVVLFAHFGICGLYLSFVHCLLRV